MAEIMAEMDPNFKERMDITMKVMFSEMGDLMSAMEPIVREALSKIYARKYSAQALADMNSFFATPSGTAFAGILKMLWSAERHFSFDKTRQDSIGLNPSPTIFDCECAYETLHGGFCGRITCTAGNAENARD